MTNSQKGLVFAFLTAVISGISITYSKAAVAKIDPLLLAALRNSTVGIMFILFMGANGSIKNILKLTRKQIFILLCIGVFGGGIPFYLFFTGLAATSALTANVIHKSLFIWVALWGVIALNEKLTRWHLFTMILLICGHFAFSTQPLHFSYGEGMILGATLLWSVETIVSKRIINDVSADIVGVFRMMIGGVFLFIFSLVSGKIALLSQIHSREMIIILAGSVLLLGYNLAWYRALQKIPASLATMALSASVVIGTLLNTIVLHTLLKSSDVFSGIALSLGSVCVILIMQKAQNASIQSSHE